MRDLNTCPQCRFSKRILRDLERSGLSFGEGLNAVLKVVLTLITAQCEPNERSEVVNLFITNLVTEMEHYEKFVAERELHDSTARLN